MVTNMTRFITVILIASLLGGCAIVPLDFGYRDRGYGYGENHRHYGDYSRHWRYGDGHR
jgi:hypothetical protein